MNTTVQKNELIFDYSSGKLGEAKSLFVSMYLYLNSIAAKKASIFDNFLADSLMNLEDIPTKKLNFKDCIKEENVNHNISNQKLEQDDPLTKVVGNLDDLTWKPVYKGFKEFSLPVKDRDDIKLIKMDPGISVPLHSHNGKEYILVLDGSFCDEYGEYKKGDLQINDQQIRHNPTSSKNEGCICLSITENDVVFFGRLGSILNLFTFIKSFFK
tara:strand:- start:29801 stop:30439 length:639 start_codon:yes stop_codon:yes gene_type:complete